MGIGVARIYGRGLDVSVFNANAAQVDTICAYCHDALLKTTPPSSTWPHLNSDVGLEEGEY